MRKFTALALKVLVLKQAELAVGRGGPLAPWCDLTLLGPMWMGPRIGASRRARPMGRSGNLRAVRMHPGALFGVRGEWE